MKIISYNVNGLRSALAKGLIEWLQAANPDVFCVQEIKSTPDQIDVSLFESLGYICYWFPAQKKGYSGVSVFTKIKPQHVIYGCGHSLFDQEGRVLELQYQNFTLINTYMPSGSSGEERQEVKFQWMDYFYQYIKEKLIKQQKLVIVGDFNICHHPIDIHNPVSNAKSSGFLPEERAWLSQFFALGFTDTFRYFDSTPHKYTWWSYRSGARNKNLGWRIDYQICTADLEKHLKKAYILSEAKHSDHCPTYLELDF